MQTDAQPQTRTRSAIGELVETILFTLLIYLVVRTFLFENYRVVGSSMEPTLQNGQFMVVNKLAYRLHPPQRGDIIVLKDPEGIERKLIKRIVGLPGEKLEIREGVVSIDGQPLKEPYIVDPGLDNEGQTVIPPGEYFVMGDNRTNSSDSRTWGLLPRADIIGKAWLTYWPPSLWGVVQHETYPGVQ